MDQMTNPPAESNFIEQFKSHPESVGETYWTHMLFAFRFGFKMIGVGLCAFVHGLIPPLFCSTGSDFIKRMHTDLMNR